jgi:hypothetical protein
VSGRGGEPGRPPDRTALAAGLSGLALATISAATRAALADRLAGDPTSSTGPPGVVLVFASVSMAGLLLGVLAIWSAAKAWLRDDVLSPPARWGGALGLAAMLFVVVVGPCGPQGCPG